LRARSAGLLASLAGVTAIITLAHISDLHATPVEPRAVGPLLGKRASGWLSWRLRRRHAHQEHVLEALIEDLQREAPDHVAITGDLTNVALEEEFPLARGWLERIGAPGWVTAVPGNHDAYVAVPVERSWQLWREYLVSDAASRTLLEAVGHPQADGLEFPSLRLRGQLALIGLCSAHPTPLFTASGSLGSVQRERLERLLGLLGERGLVRIVLIHHPPYPGATSRRRALSDAEQLCELLGRTGAELVLHGHLHKTRLAGIAGPAGEIPVVGVRSASDVGERRDRRAQYHLYEVEANAGGPPSIRLRTRGYDEATGGFRAEGPPEGTLLSCCSDER